MNRRIITTRLIAIFALLLFAVEGCKRGEDGESPPAVNTPAPPPPSAPAPPPPAVYYGPDVVVDPATGVVISPAPPPPPYVDVEVGVAPSPDFIWIGGIWVVDGGRYRWQPGHWDRRPHEGARWQQPQWEHTNRGWEHHGGRWE